MLDGLSPEQYDEFLAYRQIEHDPWDRLFTILRLGFSVLSCAWGGKPVDPHLIDPYLEKQTGTQTGTAATEYVSPNQGAAMLRMRIGAEN